MPENNDTIHLYAALHRELSQLLLNLHYVTSNLK